MGNRRLERKIYIDALVLVHERKSGVGLTLENTLKEFLEHESKEYEIYLVLPLGKAKYVKSYLKYQNVRIKTLYLPARGLELLLRLRLMPPMDWFIGRGLYIFPNYRNWPLWRSRSLTYVYDLGYKLYPKTVQPKNLRYLRRYMPVWLARTDKVLAITAQVKYEIEKYLHLPYNRVEVIPCGVDAKIFHKRDQNEIAKVKEKYDIPYAQYFLFVGNIEPRKNLATLIQGYEMLDYGLRQNYGLVIIGGDGWLNEDFYERLKAVQNQGLNILKVESYVPTQDLPALYSGATALVHPAVYEGFGMTPLEAMACETPVIVADIPAAREVVQDAGYYFDSKNASSIAKALSLIILNKRSTAKEMTLRGKEIVNDFSWQKSAQIFAGIIEDEFIEGQRSKPIIKRLKPLYVKTDQLVRALLGEKSYPPYVPSKTADKSELLQIIYADFLRENPSRFQVITLKVYQYVKYILAWPLKKTMKVATK